MTKWICGIKWIDWLIVITFLVILLRVPFRRPRMLLPFHDSVVIIPLINGWIVNIFVLIIIMRLYTIFQWCVILQVGDSDNAAFEELTTNLHNVVYSGKCGRDIHYLLSCYLPVSQNHHQGRRGTTADIGDNLLPSLTVPGCSLTADIGDNLLPSLTVPGCSLTAVEIETGPLFDVMFPIFSFAFLFFVSVVLCLVGLASAKEDGCDKGAH